MAFFLADNGDPLTTEPAQTGLNGLIVGEFSVAGQRREFLEQTLDIVTKMRALRVACNLRLLPRRQLGIKILEGLFRLGLQICDFRTRINEPLSGKASKKAKNCVLCAVFCGNCKRMVFTDQSMKPFFQNMRVNLRCRNICMAKQFLHDAQVRAIVKQMAGKGVSQNVRRQVLRAQTASYGQVFQIAGKNLSGNMFAGNA